MFICLIIYIYLFLIIFKFNASSLLQDSNGQCPLHICAAQYDKEDTEKVNAKYLACLGKREREGGEEV